MYIDIHSHIGYNKLYPTSYLSGMLGGTSSLSEEKITKITSVFLRDKYCTEFLKQMDRAEIEKTVLLILDGGIGLKEPEMSIDEIFDLHHEVLRSHPDRFIVFGGVDPRRGEKGFELFKKGIFDYGFTGLKLYPPMGYSVNDEALIPFYEICRQHQLPVLIHTGPSIAALKNEFARPENYAEALKKYPDINFILAHMGYRLEIPVIRELIKLSNVYLDITGFQVIPGPEVNTIEILKTIFSDDVNKKILFGTDWPLFNIMKPIHKHIDLIKEAYMQVKENVSADAFDNIMGKNARAILKK